MQLQLGKITAIHGDCEKEYLQSIYHVTEDGKVFRINDNKELKSCLDHKGYLRVRIKAPLFSKNEDKRKTYKVHRLVAMYYLDDYDNAMQVNHKNGIKSDNRVNNLEMVTASENATHAWNILDSSNRKRGLLKRKNKVTGRFY